MDTRARLSLVAAGFAALILGAILSRVVEPGVQVEKVMVANTPALRMFPTTPGPHPIALLAHGATGSKENMFRFGEALAAAGFNCYSVDQAGHGESLESCNIWNGAEKSGWASNILRKPREVERAIGDVDIFIGHSMGAGAGEWSVKEDGLTPNLFIAVGMRVEFGEKGPQVLLLAGLFEEIFRPADLAAVANAKVVISPWSDHILEPFDPVLASTAVMAACAAVGKPVPARATAWRWRVAGLIVGIAGALALILSLPELHPRLGRARGVLIPSVLLAGIILTMGTWVGVTPQWRRIPFQIALLLLFSLALAALSKLRLPRWTLPVATALLAVVSVALRSVYPAKIFCPGNAHEYSGCNHVVVGAGSGGRQDSQSRLFTPGWGCGDGDLCQLRDWAIYSEVLLITFSLCSGFDRAEP